MKYILLNINTYWDRMGKSRDILLCILCSAQLRRTIAITFILIFGTPGTFSRDVHSRQKRQTTCSSSFLQISPNHTMCLPDFPDRDRPLSATEKQEIVDEHNRYRINVSPPAANMMVMRWDENLAAVAVKWAQQCLGGHEDEPVRRQIPEYFGTPIGQNVRMTDKPDAAYNMKLWHDEVQFFTYGNPTGTNGKAIGHYTQIVNAYASKIGCGRASCAKSYIFVCNYARAQRSNELGRPYCLASDSTCPVCSLRTNEGLCDCANPVCLNAGNLNLQSCNCTCGRLFSGNQCQTLNCPANGKEESFCATNSVTFCTRFSNYPGFCPFTCNVCPLNPPCSLVCLNGGTLNNQACLCRCPTGFSGDQCEITGPPCSRVCLNGGTLNNQFCLCRCPIGFSGDQCGISGPGNVNGSWSTWGSWNFDSVACPVTCGRNALKPVTRRRTCTRPPPSGNGLPCPAGGGEQTINQNCGLTNDCPVDGQWTEWGAWITECTQTCGPQPVLGCRTRQRNCTRPPPQRGGQECLGEKYGTATSLCTVPRCTGPGNVNGSWSTWGSWNFNSVACPVTCGRNALKPVTRRRTCTRPPTSGNGLPCPAGGDEQTIKQNCGLTNHCQGPGNVNGSWSTWGSWNFNSVACPVTCRRNAMKLVTRRRTCTRPPPSGNGLPCPAGGDEQTVNQTCGLTNDCPGFVSVATIIAICACVLSIIAIVLVGIVFCMYRQRQNANPGRKNTEPNGNTDTHHELDDLQNMARNSYASFQHDNDAEHGYSQIGLH